MSDHDRTPPSEHPDGLLAGLVDGTLTAAERTEVQEHLAGCDRCRGEFRQAESAGRALRSLPELDPPLGLGRTAVHEARRARRGPIVRRVGVASAAAAAVVLVAAVALAVLHGGGSENNASSAPVAGATSGGGAERSAGGAKYVPLPDRRTALVHSNRDYTDQSIQRLAADVARHPAKSLSSGPGTTPSTSSPPAPSAPVQPSPSNGAAGGTTFDAAAAGPAACLARAGELPPSAVPLEIIDARFEGRLAYIGVYLAGPAGSHAPTRAEIWVASRTDCSFIQYASRRIG